MLAVLRVEDSISWGKEMKEERAKYFFCKAFYCLIMEGAVEWVDLCCV
jgi:hypothetical protein